MKAPSPGISLSRADAALVKAMLDRGDRQSDIASYFGVNAGRIAEISTGDRFGSVESATPDTLPPPGPYVYRAAASKVKRKCRHILENLEANNYPEAQRLVRQLLEEF